MVQKPADSIRFEVIESGDSIPSLKEANELALHDMAAEFFGHEQFSHTGFRHNPEPADEATLRTYAIFYDDTPYEG